MNSKYFSTSYICLHYSNIVPSSSVSLYNGKKEKRKRQKDSYIEIYKEKENYQTFDIINPMLSKSKSFSNGSINKKNDNNNDNNVHFKNKSSSLSPKSYKNERKYDKKMRLSDLQDFNRQKNKNKIPICNNNNLTTKNKNNKLKHFFLSNSSNNIINNNNHFGNFSNSVCNKSSMNLNKEFDIKNNYEEKRSNKSKKSDRSNSDNNSSRDRYFNSNKKQYLELNLSLVSNSSHKNVKNTQIFANKQLNRNYSCDNINNSYNSYNNLSPQHSNSIKINKTKKIYPNKLDSNNINNSINFNNNFVLETKDHNSNNIDNKNNNNNIKNKIK